LWFTDRGTDQIGRITTAGVVTEFALSPRFSAITQVITAGPDGALWFTRVASRTGEAGNAIGRITPSGTITLFALPTGAGPHGITAGPDGALWFTDQDGATGLIGRITTAGSISSFPLPAGSGAWHITAGPDGAIWFTEHGADRIGRMTTSGAVREFPIPYPCSGWPWGIVAGPDHALWFTETWGPNLGRVTVSGVFSDAFSGVFTYLGGAKSRATCGGGELPPQSDDAREIIVGPDGNLWVAEHTLPAIEQFVVAQPPRPTQ
jgi:virginiamycin B lyase